MAADNCYISIIMPVFNSEDFLEESIKSVICQTFTRWELLLIDDGSTDLSYSVCCSFENIDERIKIYHKENGGVSSARNYGLKMAKGEWITFIDDDDKYSPCILESLCKWTDDESVDLVKCGYIKTLISKTGKERTSYVSIKKKSPISTKEVLEDVALLAGDDYLEVMNVWNGLYKRELIINNCICFDESMKYGSEDIVFNLEYLHIAKKVVFEEELLYTHYIRNKHSLSAKYNDAQITDRIKAAKIRTSILMEMGSDSNAIGTVQVLGLISAIDLVSNCNAPLKRSRLARQLREEYGEAFNVIDKGLFENELLSFKDRIKVRLLKRKYFYILFILYRFKRLIYER